MLPDRAEPIALRRASPEDRDNLFSWRNDPWLVSFSASQRCVGEQEHARWFSRILSDPNAILLIVTRRDADLGTVRIEKVDEQRAILTVYLLRRFTGRGYGSAAIREGSRLAFEAWPNLGRLHAIIRAPNAASIVAFRKAGFSACPLHQRLERDTCTFVEMVLLRQEKSTELSSTD